MVQVTIRLAAIDGVGGDTGTLLRHLPTCGTAPHRRLDFFIVIKIISFS